MKIKDVKVMKHTKPNRDHVYALTECGKLFMRDVRILTGSGNNDADVLMSDWLDVTIDLPFE